MRNKPLTAAFVNNIRKRGRYGDGFGGHGLTLGREDSTKRTRIKMLDTASPDERQTDSYRTWSVPRDYAGNGLSSL